MGLGQYTCNSLEEYCGLSTASKVFLIFTTQLYQYFSVSLLLALLSDESEVFLPKYSQTAILNTAHFQRVVNKLYSSKPFQMLPSPNLADTLVCNKW